MRPRWLDWSLSYDEVKGRGSTTTLFARICKILGLLVAVLMAGMEIWAKAAYLLGSLSKLTPVLTGTDIMLITSLLGMGAATWQTNRAIGRPSYSAGYSAPPSGSPSGHGEFPGGK